MDRSKNFQFPIDGYVLFAGTGSIIAAFNDFKHAMKVQELLARANRGNHYTIMWCDGYSTTVCDDKPEGDAE
jgi:hypothetical protein